MTDPSFSSPRGVSALCTVSLVDRQARLLTDHFGTLRASVTLCKRVRPFTLDAWVVMPGHLHCVMTLPMGDSDFQGRWKAIRRRFVRALPQGVSAGPVWHQDIRLQELTSLVDFAGAVRACWFDPVRHEVADLPEDWVYSSIHSENYGAEVLAA